MDNAMARVSMAMMVMRSVRWAESANMCSETIDSLLPDIKMGKIRGVDKIDISVDWSPVLLDIKAINVKMAEIPMMLTNKVIPSNNQSISGKVKKIWNINKLIPVKTDNKMEL